MSDGLDGAQRERYARHLVLPDVGEEGQSRLLGASVLVVGAGGLGSPALLYLAAAGVGKIGIVDLDVVSVSNLQRQIIHSTSTIGDSKASSAARRVSDLNPDVLVEAIEQRLDHGNALDIIKRYDVVLDGTDNFDSRYLIGDACEVLGKPWVFGSIHRFDGQVSMFNLDGGPNYRDLFPEPPPLEFAPNCAEAGVLGVLPGLVGTIQATEAIKAILGIGGSLCGKLLTIDALTMEMRTLSFSANPDRVRVSSLEKSKGAMFSEISPKDYVSRLENGWAPFLLDVRRAEEEDIVSIAGTDLRIQHSQVLGRIDEIPRDRDVVIYCRVGSRSAAVARFLSEYGRLDNSIYNLSGGIHAWSETVDSSFIKY
ncbi:MAG: molybdopterin-synthase adenylyltransferase MoeB [Candidatus Thalassarchaeaceae archaeon]|nr:molybdopterin-synthase adenylyltransferase MoeB [Candidatus Thalassarchaeaceae archaeon]MDP6703454.1 molybdopterin-synthase adenylyltransferase MoeB [Candidatus Thalassarchaeaceae archaeon]MDP7004379.1 molybdopterin-synthase adenylyltransferase MoeB [Candidatus Thalassarchaeaceae archaeon]